MVTTNNADAAPGSFSVEQKEYLAGLMAGVALHVPYAGQDSQGRFTADPRQGGPNMAAPEAEMIYNTPASDATKQERWKHEEHPLDSWERILAHAQANQSPNEEDNFRFRYFGLFYVAPAENSFMLRCRIPAGELSAIQLHGLAEIADTYGNGKAAITTRANIQIRGIAPQHVVDVLTRLQSLGLTSKGSGVDNVRNITASPTAGFDLAELIDTRPFAHALHHYILNHRDLYNLPRKFNVAFEGGGAIDTVADTNDIGFMAVRVTSFLDGQSLRDGASVPVAPGIYFRLELAGITGHKQLAIDSGIVVQPAEAVAVAAAMLRTFIEAGDRTDRKKARLKYLIDQWGIPKFLEETQKRLAFPLLQVAAERCERRPPAVKHGHVGVYRQRQKGRNYIGVVIPVGILASRQMRRLADMAQNYGSGSLRLTPWQNLLLPDVTDGFVESVKRQLVRVGLHYEANHVCAGLVACTGNQGCKYAATDTKAHAVTIGQHLSKRLTLDHPLNIHFTGCSNSCAQHYVGDIGLMGVKVTLSGEQVEGYNVALGGGTGDGAGIAQDVFKGVPVTELPALLEHVLQVYLQQCQPGETFVQFVRRHNLKQLQEMFSA